MKVLIMTLGTRGDVQPFIALARGLLAAGHEVVLTAPQRFAGFAAGHGVPFAGVDDGPMRLMDDPAMAGSVIEGGARARLQQVRTMPAMFTQVLADCWAVASDGAGAGADVVVHNGQIIAGQHVAEKLGIPAVLALPIPMYVPTKEFPWPGVGMPSWLPAAANRATFLGMKAPAAIFGRVVDRWREDILGLPRRRGRHDPLRRPDNGQAPVLHAFSPSVLPPPADYRPDSVHTTGYFPSALGRGATAARRGLPSRRRLAGVRRIRLNVRSRPRAQHRPGPGSGTPRRDTPGDRRGMGRTGQQHSR